MKRSRLMSLIKSRRLWSLALVILMVNVGLSARAEGLDVGQAAPDFTLPDNTGQPHSLHSALGKNVVLVWFKPQCPAYKRHLRENTFENLSKQFTADQATIIMIDLSPFEPQPTPTPVANPNPASSAKPPAKPPAGPAPTPILILHDPKGTVARLYHPRNYTETYVLDRQGTLVYYGAMDNDPQGTRNPSTIENYAAAALEALLAGRQPKVTHTQPYGCMISYSIFGP